MLHTNKPELLAPVGSWEAFIAAVENGADAVYLGGKRFSARQYANNFDEAQLIEAFNYAHLRNVKVFVTVNTLLKNHELADAVDYLKFLYEHGVDAVIVQDLGLVRLCRELLPDLELHASTQMTVHNALGVKALQEMGFARIVLAREVTLENIKLIKHETGAELEAFIHGALCVSYSGQCLMSSLIGGRSGNRGRCAQPCRLKYVLVDDEGRELITEEQGQHLLSPKDLKTVDFIPQLIEAGIDSFKIEGRMKKPEYVATVVRVYREAIDRYFAKECDFYVPEEDEQDLRQIFNRDFSSGYFFGNLGRNLMSYKRPNNRGVRLGRVVGFDKENRRVFIDLVTDLSIGDGVEVWVSKGGRQGLTVNEIWVNNKKVDFAQAGTKVAIDLPGKVSMGDRVFKTLDARLMNRARATYETPHRNRKQAIDMTVNIMIGEPLELLVEDESGNKAQAITDFKAEQAQKRPLTYDILFKQLNRLGNTPYELNHLEVNIQGEVMVPISEINEVRRKAIELLEQNILAKYSPKPISSIRLQEGYKRLLASEAHKTAKTKLSIFTQDLELVRYGADNGCKSIYFGGEALNRPQFTDKELEEAIALCKDKCDLIISTPRILQDEKLERYEKTLDRILALEPQGFLVSNFGVLKLLRAKDYQGQLIGDFGFNSLNSVTCSELKQLGINRVTISPELSFQELKELLPKLNVAVECIVHGFLPMMVSEYCAIGSLIGEKSETRKCQGACKKGTYYLRDRMNFDFPLAVDQFCHMHVFNPKELAMIEDLPVFLENGVELIRLDLRLHEVATAKRIIHSYQQMLRQLYSNPLIYDASKNKEELEQLSPKGLTKGHYYRGVE